MNGATVTKLSPATQKNRIRTIIVTPELATELLEKNKVNRPLRQTHVQRIANQIRLGKWQFNGDTIKISDSEDVLDGQHRLWAVIEANKPIETIIVYGIEKEAFSTIDTIRQSRNGSDVLALMGLTRYRGPVSEALKWLVRWQRKYLPDIRNPKHRIENADVETAFENNPQMAQAAEVATKLRGLVNPAVMAFMYYIIVNRNPELAERMIATLEDPVQVAASDPFFRLRQYFTNDHHKRKDPLTIIALTIKAANAAHRKQRVERLNWKSQGDKPEPFPVLAV